MDIPEMYRAGYERARAVNPTLADRYVEYTMIDDPPADEAIGSLAGMDQREVHRLINAAMEQQEDALRAAPAPFREFFEQISDPPPWFNGDSVYPGRRLFHNYSDLFIPAFFVVTLQNAATLISKAFYATGRVLSGQAPRRIRQNTRHFIEIMLPQALERQSEGWKLSVRIRLVHAQVRQLIRESGQWDESVYGVPLSSAHMAFASANFSATMLLQAKRMGARMNAAERDAFMQIWRYASVLIGTPEDLLFEGDYDATAELYQVGRLCEPPPSPESVAIANALVQALPDIAGMTDSREGQTFVKYTYGVSRALLGRELADQLEFPRYPTFGLLPWLRLKCRLYTAMRQRLRNSAGRWRGNNFVFLLEASQLIDLSYQMPDRLEASRARPW